MVVKKITRDQLISVATELFRTQGYHNTSIADIAKACDLSKASIYHHINSKLDLAIAAIQNTLRYARETIFSLATESDGKEKERLSLFMTMLKDYYMNCDGICLVGNLTHELNQSKPELQTLLKTYFAEWLEALSILLKKQFGEKAKEVAEDIIIRLQGALLIDKLQGNHVALSRTCQQVVELI